MISLDIYTLLAATSLEASITQREEYNKLSYHRVHQGRAGWQNVTLKF